MSETIEARLARSLAAWMEAKGIGVTDLYKRSGVSRTTLHEVLAGRRLPSIDSLERIAEELGTTLGRLLDGVMPPPKPNTQESAFAALRESFENPAPLPPGVQEIIQTMQERLDTVERRLNEKKPKP